MGAEVDSDGQPLDRRLNWKRLRDSRTDELIGICRGILADGVLVYEEARFLLDWLERNRPVRFSPLGRALEPTLIAALRDGTLSGDEEEELVTLIFRLVGITPHYADYASVSTTLPLDNPVPVITFLSRMFCFTGKFVYGTRSACERAVQERGAIVHPRPVKDTSFLVIGEIGSRDWAHSPIGRKIERAIELRTSGVEIRIVSEASWAAAM